MTDKPMPTPDEISQINHEHREAVKASKGLLDHPIKCGEMLKAAKAKVGHGEWDKWLTKNCPEISDRTARLYMRLATKQPELEKVAKQNGNAVADLSIRGAAKSISKKQTPEQKETRRKNQQPQLAPTVIKDQLQALDVDGVLNLLVETFDQDFLDTLEERLSEHLAPSEVEEKDDLGIPSSLRRELQ
jgi:hypothetical protein